MDADRLMAAYATSDAARQKSIISQLSEHAMALACAGKEREGLRIHSFIAEIDPPARADTAGDWEALAGEAMQNFGDPAGIKQMQANLLEFLPNLMDMTGSLIDMSRACCEEAGIPCPPSIARVHETEVRNRPAEDRIPSAIRALVIGLGHSEMQADELRPFAHKDNDWMPVMNAAVHNNDDPEVFATLLAFVRDHQLCEGRELRHLPQDRAAFVQRKLAEDRARQSFARFLDRNHTHAEAALRGLVAAMRAIGATAANYDCQLILYVSEHDGKGELPDTVDLVTGYDEWVESLSDDEHGAERGSWRWIHERWLAIGGPACGLTVTLFYNGSGESMDLTTGREG